MEFSQDGVYNNPGDVLGKVLLQQWLVTVDNSSDVPIISQISDIGFIS